MITSSGIWGKCVYVMYGRSSGGGGRGGWIQQVWRADHGRQKKRQSNMFFPLSIVVLFVFVF